MTRLHESMHDNSWPHRRKLRKNCCSHALGRYLFAPTLLRAPVSGPPSWLFVSISHTLHN